MPPALKSIDDVQAELAALGGRYKAEEIVGSGAYGLVLRAEDLAASEPGTTVAIKRVNADVFDDLTEAKRVLREISLLSYFKQHPNIVGLRDVLVQPTVDEFTGAFYFVMDYMPTDLRQVRRIGHDISESQVKKLMLQALNALKAIHGSKVIHRDVAPANLLVDRDWNLRFADFGIARDEGEDMTDYVTMRWYRAPELVMQHRNYSTQVDMWGLGLIFAELLGSRPLCQGTDHIDQLDKILMVIGTPGPDDMSAVGSAGAQKYLRSREPQDPVDFEDIFPHANSFATDLLERMLVYNPSKRITAADALKHPFLSGAAADADSSSSSASTWSAPEPFVFDESSYGSVEEIKTAILKIGLTFAENAKSA